MVGCKPPLVDSLGILISICRHLPQKLDGLVLELRLEFHQLLKLSLNLRIVNCIEGEDDFFPSSLRDDFQECAAVGLLERLIL